MAKKHKTEKIVETEEVVTINQTIVKTVHTVEQAPERTLKKTREYWNVLGPGLTTGAADDDPSGIATYSQAGAQYGFQLIWMSLFCYPLAAAIQEICARIGLATGRGLASNIRIHFDKRILFFCTLLLFAANAFNIGADLGAMAKGVQLLRPGLSFSILVIGFALLCVLLQIYLPYAKYAHFLKWLALVLLAYVASAILAHIHWGAVLRHTVTPTIHWSKEQLLLICAILGTTISPYLFFWQTSQEVEDEILDGKTTLEARQKEFNVQKLKAMRLDVWSGMLLSELVMFFIIAACGALLFSNGVTNITSAAQAAEALRPFAGNSTYWLFAIGIIGTGMLAIPVLAGASSYAVTESFKWKEGLYRKFKQAHAFYGTIILSVIIGFALNFLGIDPIKALIYSAVANGIVAPVVLILIMVISSNKKIMGEWTNGKGVAWFGWLITSVMVLSGAAAIWALF
jgi:NRAMP (natural resistance-associated macrophage protein)-like metal ion transporter